MNLNSKTGFAVMSAVAGVAFVCAAPSALSQGSGKPAAPAPAPHAAPAPAPAPAGGAGVTLKVPAAMMTAAKAPKAGEGASQKTAIGAGACMMDTKNSPTDTDSFWSEQIDLNSDGTADKTDVLWDDEDKVLYYHAEVDFPCKNGGKGKGDVLFGINAAGNARNRPVGSGFYIVALDKMECGSQMAGLWGCKFDATGKTTSCGMATIDAKNDDIVIATESAK